jgi:hypothetical protein
MPSDRFERYVGVVAVALVLALIACWWVASGLSLKSSASLRWNLEQQPPTRGHEMPRGYHDRG